MKALVKFLSLILVLAFAFACTPDTTHDVVLDSDWQFKHPDSSEWLAAQIPGSVHMDLLHHGLIDDPFYGSNEKALTWVGTSDWEYKTSFSGQGLRGREHAQLVFEGLDTYADVYLNDSLVLHADNMFRTWRVNIRHLVRPDRNDLYIRFYAPRQIEKDKGNRAGYKLPQLRAFTRKAPYQYGWDWGPEFITAGIWQPVRIVAWDGFRIRDLQATLQERTDSSAAVALELTVQSTGDFRAFPTMLLDGKKTVIREESVELEKGINHITLQLEIPQPQLWWPNGLGEQKLYQVEVQLESVKFKDTEKTRIGIREVELVRNPDSVGESFYFKVNGVPVFMKGANYIPQDNFLSRVPEEKYRQTLQAAVDAHMNMIRVWGGGVYERDIFYDLCDEMGLLVWQDFMFACTMYPGDTAYLRNVEHEALQQVKRLRNHPSIALWCGNNEVKEGWFNWGWQSSLGYSKQDSVLVWNNYLKVFEDILPRVVKTVDPGRAYWPSSPSIGWGHEEAKFSGDMHYWGVWWGEEPFDVYENKVGRFMTEFGFQGFPALSTLDSCLGARDQNLQSKHLANHQKHPRGMELIRLYMERDYPLPQDFDDYAYVSQLLQANGIRIALEAHRRAMPYCMGTLYWQLNDCWPVISWSSLDYYNNWKALHYFTREVFEPLTISFDEQGQHVDVYVITDLQTDTEALLKLRLLEFDGRQIWEDEKPIVLPANTSNVFNSVDRTKRMRDIDPGHVVLHATLYPEGKPAVSAYHYFARPRFLKLHDSNLETEVVQKDRDTYVVSLTSSTLEKNVWLSLNRGGHFSNNYFDILPGDTIEVNYSKKSNPSSPFPANPDEFRDLLKIVTLNDM